MVEVIFKMVVIRMIIIEEIEEVEIKVILPPSARLRELNIVECKAGRSKKGGKLAGR